MNITILELDDITDEFIKMNYNIDTERKIKKRLGSVHMCIFDINIAPINEFLLDFKDVYDEAMRGFKVPKDFKLVRTTVEPFMEWDYFTVQINCYLERPETDEEVIKRLTGSINIDIKKYQKVKKGKTKLAQRLKVKYGDVNEN